MRVLVTGANGFIGLHLCKKLREKDIEVYALVRSLSKGDDLRELGCLLIEGDILDVEKWEHHFLPFDVVYHLAGYSSSSTFERQKLIEVNGEGTRKLLEQCLKHKIGKFIHVSSCVTFGFNQLKDDIPRNEQMESRDSHFQNVHSKLLGENYVLDAVKKENLFAVILNPSLVYGAGDAQKEMRRSNIDAAKGKLPFYTEGGVSIVSVHEVVNTMIEVIEKGRSGERYLLSGDNITIQELFNTISESAGTLPPRHCLGRNFLRFLGAINKVFRLSDQLSEENILSASGFFWYDHQKATNELNFKPGNYKTSIRESVEWMKEKGLI